MIEISAEYIPKDSDASLCEKCEEVIKGTMYVLTIKVGDTAKGLAKFCVLCYNRDNSGTNSEENDE